MILIALAVALAPFGDEPVLASPAFDRFVAAADTVCPERKARNITPADLDGMEEGFIATLSPARRGRLAAVDGGGARCAGRDGLACPTSATLEALAGEQLMAPFAAYTCRTVLPR